MSSLNIIDTLDNLQGEALEKLRVLTREEDLETWRVVFLGRKGKLTSILRAIKELPQDQKQLVGAKANQVKKTLEESLSNSQDDIKEIHAQGIYQEERVDVTRPGRPLNRGRLHPLTQIMREICGAFVAMGFQVIEGPEVEWDHYNFELLNIPKNHPARDMWNTLWIDYQDVNGEHPMLLRTHTSPMQARVMEASNPPVRVIVPGKVYRYEATDATHEWHFHQIEGLAVDEGITFANMKGTLYEFARRVFGSERRVRFRCDYFPFVEPGVDMSIDCFTCDGNDSNCRICRGTGWLEIMGAGMVHPKVLEGVGYDSAKYTGFAFGLGPERIAMLKYGIEDIRLFYSNDLRFLKQFNS